MLIICVFGLFVIQSTTALGSGKFNVALVRSGSGINEELSHNITEILSESEEVEFHKFVLVSIRLTFEEFERVSELVSDLTVQIEKVKKARLESGVGPKSIMKEKKPSIIDRVSLTLDPKSLSDESKMDQGSEKYIMASIRITLEEFKFVMDLMSGVNIEIDGLVDEVKN